MADDLLPRVTKPAPLNEGFLQFMEAAPDAMVCVDGRGRIVLVNAQTERIFGRSRNEILGQPIEVLIPSRYGGAHVKHRDGFLADPHVRPMGLGLDLFALHKDGTEFPVEVSLSPIDTPDGPIVAASIRDTSERVRAERKFRSLLDSAPDAIVVVDETGAMVLVNAQAEAVFGYSREEMLDHKVEMLIPERFAGPHEGHRDGFFRAPKARSMGSGLQLFARRKDGTEFPVEISLSPIDIDEGRLVAAAVRDVSARKAAEAQAREAEEQKRQLEQLRAIDEFRARFINAAAHELYTPLTPIAATLKVFQNPTLRPEDRERAMQILGRNFTRLEGLVTDLLEAARFQSGSVNLNKTRFDLTELVTVAVDSFDAAAREGLIDMTLDASGPLRVHADENRINQVVFNLLSNALKFTAAGGAINVRVGLDEGVASVVVEDDGLGLDDEQMERLFTPFHRMHEGVAPGSGLGLYIAQGFITAHEGRLWATSQGPGKGARFQFTLPLDDA